MKRFLAGTVFLVLTLSASLLAAEPAWTRRLETALKKMLRDPGSALQIATAIQRITHPSGSQPFLLGHQVFTAGPEVKDPPDSFRVVAKMQVGWTGAFKGSRTVSVRWELTRHEHGGAIVEDDDAPVRPSKKDAIILDDYFLRLYPNVMQAAGLR